MATTTNLGGVFTTDYDGKSTSNVFLSTENVVGLIFDTSIVGGLNRLWVMTQLPQRHSPMATSLS